MYPLMQTEYGYLAAAFFIFYVVTITVLLSNLFIGLIIDAYIDFNDALDAIHGVGNTKETGQTDLFRELRKLMNTDQVTILGEVVGKSQIIEDPDDKYPRGRLVRRGDTDLSAEDLLHYGGANCQYIPANREKLTSFMAIGIFPLMNYNFLYCLVRERFHQFGQLFNRAGNFISCIIE